MKTLVVIFLLSGLALSQSTTTHTDCSFSGNDASCTSKTDEDIHCYQEDWLVRCVTPSEHERWLAQKRADAERRAAASANESAERGQQAQPSQEVIKELLAEQNNKDTVDFIYCRQNPRGSITDYEGKQKTCADVIEYTKAFCSVNPKVERCTLAKSKMEVEKAFTSLVNDYNTDPRRKKKDAQMYFDSLFAKLTKWGCMSYPDMILPQRDGTAHPCPSAPESGAVSINAASQTK